MIIVKDYFKSFSSKNIFKFKVLVKVLYKDKLFVGLFVVVSEFLRFLCLYIRIVSFKQNFKKVIVLNKFFVIKDNQNWLLFVLVVVKNYELEVKFFC